MNFRTTILLLAVLVAAAVVYFVASSRDAGNKTATGNAPGDDPNNAGKRLIETAPADVTKIVVSPADGERVVFERSGAAEWRLVEPVQAQAEAFKVDDLVRELSDLRSRGQVDAGDKGVAQPRYTIELTGKDNKTTKLNVGNRSPVGDTLYVRLEGETDADIVSASVLTQLAKPAGEYRKLRLANVPQDEVTGISVTDGDKTLRLSKAGGQWQVVEPVKIPADEGQVSSLVSAVNGLNAVAFVEEKPSSVGLYGLSRPTLTVSLSTAPPATQPTTQPAGGATRPAAAAAPAVTVKFGRPDVEKQNVYAITSDSGPVVTVAATELNAFRKTPLDLRDREVLSIAADAVSRIAIAVDKVATTQPTSQPAVKKQLVLERRSEVTPAGPPVPAAPATTEAATQASTNPTTGAATQPTTQPTTAPAAPATKWVLTSDPKGDANDANVQSLLSALQPLRVDKFLEQFPTTQAAPAATYTLKLNARSWANEPAKDYDLKITDPGTGSSGAGTGRLIGQLGDLTFELPRTLVDRLTADFTPSKEQPAAPAFPGLPGGLGDSPVSVPGLSPPPPEDNK